MGKRNWPVYNEQLVRRGEALLDMSVLEGWDDELERMNRRKRGRPYSFPASLFRFLAFLRQAQRMPLRQMEGLLRSLTKALNLRAPDHSTIWCRLLAQPLRLRKPRLRRGKGHAVATDSTGLKVSNRGEWLRDKWHVHRGWIKAHVAVEVGSGSVVGVVVTDERAPDHRFLPQLVRQAERRLPGPVKRVLADAAYDTRDNFAFLRERGIDAAIPVRAGASRKSLGKGLARSLAVGERRRIGETGWRLRHQYRIRWKVETTFSAVKRVIGESVMSRRRDIMLREAEQMFAAYNQLMGV